MPKVLTCAYCRKNLLGGTYTLINHVLKQCPIFDEKRDPVTLTKGNHTSIVSLGYNNTIDSNTYIKDNILKQDEPISN